MPPVSPGPASTFVCAKPSAACRSGTSSCCRRFNPPKTTSSPAATNTKQRAPARQIWDEVKHGQLHADVLLRGGFIKREEELMDDPRANTQPKFSCFGLTAMFPHIHPLARAGQHFYNESMACLGIAATLSVIDDELIRHQ